MGAADQAVGTGAAQEAPGGSGGEAGPGSDMAVSRASCRERRRRFDCVSFDPSAPSFVLAAVACSASAAATAARNRSARGQAPPAASPPGPRVSFESE